MYEVVNHIIHQVPKAGAGTDRGDHYGWAEAVDDGQVQACEEDHARYDGEDESVSVLGEGMMDPVDQEVEEEAEFTIGWQPDVLSMEEEPVEQVLGEGPEDDPNEDASHGRQDSQLRLGQVVQNDGEPDYGDDVPVGLGEELEEWSIEQDNVPHWVNHVFRFLDIENVLFLGVVESGQLVQKSLRIIYLELA